MELTKSDLTYYKSMREGPCDKKAWENAKSFSDNELKNIKDCNYILITIDSDSPTGYWMYPFYYTSTDEKGTWIHYTYYWHRTQYGQFLNCENVKLLKYE